MSNIKILIVDDESIARQRISRFLKAVGGDFLIHEATNGLEAIEYLNHTLPDLIFLDIQMPGLSGFEVLQQVEHREFSIIFQTAHDDYAIQAFEESACDYLLKPFTKERFEKALDKALKNKGQKEKLRDLESQLYKSSQFLNKITFKQTGKLKILPLEEVTYFISQDHYTSVHTISGNEHIIDLSITYLSEHLDPNLFIRCHRKAIAALNQIKTITGTTDSSLELKNGTKLSLSRSNRPQVLQKFQQT